jgi:hypothetical protein
MPIVSLGGFKLVRVLSTRSVAESTRLQLSRFPLKFPPNEAGAMRVLTGTCILVVWLHLASALRAGEGHIGSGAPKSGQLPGASLSIETNLQPSQHTSRLFRFWGVGTKRFGLG